jgi:hypothetical protein
MQRREAMKSCGVSFTGVSMANDFTETFGAAAEDKNTNEHLQTYLRVMAMLKWGTVALAVLLILMAFFLVRH